MWSTAVKREKQTHSLPQTSRQEKLRLAAWPLKTRRVAREPQPEPTLPFPAPCLRPEVYPQTARAQFLHHLFLFHASAFHLTCEFVRVCPVGVLNASLSWLAVLQTVELLHFSLSPPSSDSSAHLRGLTLLQLRSEVFGKESSCRLLYWNPARQRWQLYQDFSLLFYMQYLLLSYCTLRNNIVLICVINKLDFFLWHCHPSAPFFFCLTFTNNLWPQSKCINLLSKAVWKNDFRSLTASEYPYCSAIQQAKSSTRKKCPNSQHS